MYNQILSIDNKKILVTSKKATEQINLDYLDIEFIEKDIFDNNAKNGELEVIVNEGLINIQWSIEK